MDNIKEYETQLEDIRTAFPQAFIFLVVCGLPITKKLASNSNEVVHYSKTPLGLGVPNKLIVDKSIKSGVNHLIIIDGDRQHIIQNIRNIYEKNLSSDSDVIIPERKKRFLFTREELHGPTVEDILNGFLRYSIGCNLNDPVPGVYIFLKTKKLQKFKFDESKSWVGDNELLKNIFESGLSISSPLLHVRENIYTISNRDLIFNSLTQNEKFFGVEIEEISNYIKNNPEKSLFGGNFYEVDRTVETYKEFKTKSKIRKMKAIILAGGKGTKLKPFTHTIQKQLFPIANKPILHYVMKKVVETGIREVGVIVGPKKEQVMESLGDGSRWNCRITYIEQDAPAGLAHAVATARKFLGDSSFLMILGDTVFTDDLTLFLQEFIESEFPVSLVLARVNDPTRCGIVELDSHGKVIRLVEKPREPKSDLAIIGIYAFTNKIHDAISKIKPSSRGELEITDAIQRLCEEKFRINYKIISSRWEDTGSPESLINANILILGSIETSIKGKIHPNTTIRGNVEIGAGTEIKENSFVIGPVSIGENCVIGPNAFIGPYTSVGNNCVIKSAEVLCSLILDNTKIECPERIFFSILGKNCIVTSDSNADLKRVMLLIGDNTNITI